ncbi:MAG: NAD-dependent epimerase/dehydratase family protein [Nitrospirota bacterium]|nr:NAD-dependent epimerase/dehydratase family protein [Nitrospirota bacterium]
MKALVTGANGLIGANLVRELLDAGYGVRAFVRQTSDVRSLENLPIEFAHGDVLNVESLGAAMQGCDIVFHTAAVFSYWGISLSSLEQLAVEGTTNIIEVAHQAGIRRVVFTSSSVVFGSSNRPLVRNETHHLDDQDSAPYVLAKALQEGAAFDSAEKLGVELVAVCPTMTVGPYGYRLGPSNGLIVSYLMDGLRTTYPGGCNIVSAEDVAKGHRLAAENGLPGERYLLGSENLKWQTIHQMISELCGLSGPHWEANHTLSFLAAMGHELASRVTGTPPLVTRTQAGMVGRYYWYDHTKAAELGYRPAPARQALAKAIAWLSASPHISRQLRTSLRLSREVFQAKQANERRTVAKGVTT